MHNPAGAARPRTPAVPATHGSPAGGHVQYGGLPVL
ncbi:hypothetical protein STRAU_5469 [Streptomyces aurantiacus JA 4570]|uniref:Uncharacterized protein n=1 Tax=Streptomyces aurantiacus JA 4570 TaxID=1286094 RepID=S3ZST3_9ACTN|nr:hypothetical protein STRAU_5469 [Streptomyces aurantiacus JA 4570]